MILSLDRLPKDEIPEYLRRQWMPQATGITIVMHDTIFIIGLKKKGM